MPTDIHGILLLDKPLGVSSAGAVARIKRLFGARKAGHTGSLDPLASGMLPICFGEATKFGAQLLDADKTYRVTARLGERTASGDRESEVIERRELPEFSAQQIERALAEFPREYAQVPPMHSAIKQDGKPLYEYARAGITRERAARIRELIEANFKVVMGRWRDMPVGPHPQAMYQVAFETDQFARLVPWLMLNRDGLTVLVHPNTSDAYTDHLVNPLWLGDKLQLNAEVPVEMSHLIQELLAKKPDQRG